MGPNMELSNNEKPIEKKRRIPDPPFHRSIILDGVKAADMRTMNLMYCCEQCSYYSAKAGCAMGFKYQLHLRENQLRLWELTGKMAICRSQEVD
jgi:hypothetical protein